MVTSITGGLSTTKNYIK